MVTTAKKRTLQSPAGSTKAKTSPVPPVPAERSPQEAPVFFRGDGGRVVAGVKIDSAQFKGARIEIVGWMVGSIDLRLLCEGVAQEMQLTRKQRPDVVEATRVPEKAHGHGFSVVAARAPGAYSIELDIQGEAYSEVFAVQVEDSLRIGPGGKAGAVGFLEVGSASGVTGDGVVFGWAVAEDGARVWLETDGGEVFPLTGATILTRHDVIALHAANFGSNAREAGFIARITGVGPGSMVRLMSQKAHGPQVVSEVLCSAMPVEPGAASRWLFALATPMARMAARCESVDAPILNALIAHHQRDWHKLSVEVHDLGLPPVEPRVSIIVPLYGRTDFVEHQLMEFSRDRDLQAQAEIIYVVDDPAVLDAFASQAELLHRLYQVSFRWVWGSVNRGFSGANNLGASLARGRHLLFLNSDAIPQQPGWLQPMLALLEANASIGAVGPRLTYADGSIQHAGMAFRRRHDLGIWANEHPQSGLDPALDLSAGPTVMPAVTGACIALRREIFDKVGGWDTGYLIGDFEDSDLCLKLRSAGLKIVYTPQVQLTHLERQSFKLLGDGDYRTRVVVFNAARHQGRWGDLLGAAFQSGPL